MTDPLSRVRVVLHEPQDPVNIAAVVRAMKNMGLTMLTLVRPAEYDPSRIRFVAHDSDDLVASIRHCETVEDALDGCVLVAAYTARQRAAKRRVAAPREAATELVRSTDDGDVAILFGREDRGLDNEALDRANLVVTIPTTDYASLNLAQAAVIAMYELRLAAPEHARARRAPRKDAPPATSEQFERLFADIEQALRAIEFFKTRNDELVLRTVRSLTFRAAPDAREIDLVRAMAIEVSRALERARRRP
ncbi:MAG TPA: TrmJ/YjtD family RNA methyltransferase [Gemmatimonadaceae bacterium]|nr:TrmJ/YjtD family RNA methyltransferase [Gemmatimonadaceae bacterium]